MSKPCGHDADQPACGTCRLGRDPKVRAIWAAATAAGRPLTTRPTDPGRGVGGPRRTGTVTPCPHRGEPTGETVACPSCRGTVGLKVLACAIHGTCTIAKPAAGHACCATCPDRPAAARKRDPWGHPVAVPEPPPLALTPTSPRAVVTCAAGREGRDLLAVSGPWLRAYAARLGADFVVLDWPGVPGWGQSGKFALWRVFEWYDRVAFLDADTVADPALAPDLFGLVPPGAVGIYDDAPGLLRYPAGGALIEEYQRLRVQQGGERRAVRFYGNTGVVVADRGHAPVFAPPAGPIPPLHCAEQHLWIMRLHDWGGPVVRLPAAGNYQWWDQAEYRDPPPAEAILHFAGLRPHRSAGERLAVMRQWAARLRPPR